MSIFLVGGGPDTLTTDLIFRRFAGEIVPGSAAGPTVAVILFDHEGSGNRFLSSYAAPLGRHLSCAIRPVFISNDEPVDPEHLRGVQGILVGGGPTPAYCEGLVTAAAMIRRMAAAGIPYLGFSAGAMIASAEALVGGYRVKAEQVCPEESSEGLEEVTIRPGLGLVPFVVDVHAAQAGTVSRGIAVVAHGLADAVVAIDEDTALVVGGGTERGGTPLGTGSAWTIGRSAGIVTVSVRNAD
ncbi:MAG: Type 1 glutamine amidotransferase-like domain-containing protein [Actinomycetales bacterium]